MHLILYYYIHAYVYTYIHFHWKEHDHANERQMVSQSHYALSVSTTLLGRWYYVNAVPTRVVLRQSGYYYVATRSLPRSLAATLLLRNLAVLADHTTLLPRFYYVHPVPITLIRFPLRSRLFMRA